MYKLDKIDDPNELPKIFLSLINADNDFKVLPARQWTENFLYYGGMKSFSSRFSTSTVQGNSLLTALQTRNSARRLHIPKVFKACQVQASNATRQRASIKVWPENDDETSDRKAKLSNILLDYFWDLNHEDDEYYAAVLWCLLTPAVARKDYFDYKFNAARLWPVEEEAEEMVPSLAPDGSQIMVSQKSNECEARFEWRRCVRSVAVAFI